MTFEAAVTAETADAQSALLTSAERTIETVYCVPSVSPVNVYR